VRDFRREQLGEWLYERRALFDVWDKNACIARPCDHPYLLVNRMQSGDFGWRVRSKVDDIAPHIERVKRLLADGALSTQAFKDDPAGREAVERMVSRGEAGIHHREGRRRFFGLIDSILPPELHAPVQMDEREWDEWYVLRRIGAVGLLWARGSVAYISAPLDTPRRHAAIERLVERGKLIRVQVEGLNTPLYCNAEHQDMFEEKDRPAKATTLGPLDNMLWDRSLIEKLFGYHYSWEVYTPNEQRKYGSYTLPVLYGDRFIGRTQLRQGGGTLSVDNWWPEDGLKTTAAMSREVVRALEAHAAMLGIPYDGRAIL
jgi:uncharacterized protein YcaQ